MDKGNFDPRFLPDIPRASISKPLPEAVNPGIRTGPIALYQSGLKQLGQSPILGDVHSGRIPNHLPRLASGSTPVRAESRDTQVKAFYGRSSRMCNHEEQQSLYLPRSPQADCENERLVSPTKPFLDHPRISGGASHGDTSPFSDPDTTRLPPLSSLYKEENARNTQQTHVTQPGLCQMCSRAKPLMRDVARVIRDLDESLGYSIANEDDVDSRKIPAGHATESHLSTISKAIQELQRYYNVLYHSIDKETPTMGNPVSPPQEQNARLPPLSSTSPSMSHVPSSNNRHKRRRTQSPARQTPYPGLGVSTPLKQIPAPEDQSPLSPTSESRVLFTLPSPASLGFGLDAQRVKIPGIRSQSLRSDASEITQSSVHSSQASMYSNPNVTAVSSATLGHVADLQRQVTLKSLSLQTLQSEYSSILQKLQREKVRSNTVDKKANVAQQEVNSLTTKNEELSEEIRALQRHMEDREKREEEMQKQHAKEKEQYMRMLSMNNKMQAKRLEEKQQWADEKSRLLAMTSNTRPPGSPSQYDPQKDMTSPSLSIEAPSQHMLTKLDTSALARQVHILQAALRDVKKESDEIEQQSQALAARNAHVRSTVQEALQATSEQPREAAKEADV